MGDVGLWYPPILSRGRVHGGVLRVHGGFLMVQGHETTLGG